VYIFISAWEIDKIFVHKCQHCQNVF